MDSKLTTIAGYLCVGLVIVSVLTWHLWKGSNSRSSVPRQQAAAICALLIAVMYLICSSPFPGVSAVACTFGSAFVVVWWAKAAPMRIDWPWVAVLFLDFCLAMTLAWWRRRGPSVDISNLELVALQGLLIVATFALIGKGDDTRNNALTWRLTQAVFFLGAAQQRHAHHVGVEADRAIEVADTQHGVEESHGASKMKQVVEA